MATAVEMGYKTGGNYNYYTAGKRCNNMSEEQAECCFDELACQYGVKEGFSWDDFWSGYFNY